MSDCLWVKSGVKEQKKKHFCIKVENRTEDKIKAFKPHLLISGLIFLPIYGECTTLFAEMNFYHFSVNHKYNYKDQITGVHIKTIEG